MTGQAEDDLADIWAFIAADNPAAATFSSIGHESDISRFAIIPNWVRDGMTWHPAFGFIFTGVTPSTTDTRTPKSTSFACFTDRETHASS